MPGVRISLKFPRLCDKIPGDISQHCKPSLQLLDNIQNNQDAALDWLVFYWNLQSDCQMDRQCWQPDQCLGWRLRLLVVSNQYLLFIVLNTKTNSAQSIDLYFRAFLCLGLTGQQNINLYPHLSQPSQSDISQISSKFGRTAFWFTDAITSLS